MKRLAHLTLIAAAVAATPARGQASETLPTSRITIELRNVTLESFFGVIGSAGGFTSSVDACASTKKLTLKMRNAPLDVVVRAVAEREHLTYRLEANRLSVGCAGAATATQAAQPMELAALRAENARLAQELADARRQLAARSRGGAGE